MKNILPIAFLLLALSSHALAVIGYTPISQSAAGTSRIIVLSTNQNAAAGKNVVVSPNTPVSLLAYVSSGASLTYSVQVTDDPTPTDGGNWNNHDTLLNQTSSANGNIAFPITGIRLNVTNYTSGTVTLGVAGP